MAIPKDSTLIRIVLTPEELKAISTHLLTPEDIKKGGSSWALKKYLFEKSKLGTPLTTQEKNLLALKTKRMEEKKKSSSSKGSK